MSGGPGGTESPPAPSDTSRSRTGGRDDPCSSSRSARPYIGTRINRPVAGQPAAVRSAWLEPVSTKLPGAAPSSTARLTAPSTSGTTCHSSTSNGKGPTASAASGSARTTAASAGRSSRNHSRQWRRPVVVLPHARGPTTRTAGWSASNSSSNRSTIRGRYSGMTNGPIVIQHARHYAFSTQSSAYIARPLLPVGAARLRRLGYGGASGDVHAAGTSFDWRKVVCAY